MQAENLSDEVDLEDDYLDLLKSALSERDHEQSDEESIQDFIESWSEDEKDRFFAALESHSSLRPDLIAEYVGSKNIAEVCVYLSALEEAAKTSGTESLRSNLDIAMEISDAWLKVEEDQAAFFRDVELAWRSEALQQDDFGLDVQNKRKQTLKALSVAHLKAIDRVLHNEEDSADIQVEPPEDASKPDPDPASDLSPAERRRMQKRMYMRRKRAEASGTVVNTDALKLQRGRKRKVPQVAEQPSSSLAAAEPSSSGLVAAEATPAPDEIDSSGSESEEDSDGDRPRKRQKKRGVTKYQKFLDIFTELGIDSNMLHEQNLDLFHLVSLGRLLTLYENAYSPSEAVSAISSDVIRLLNLVLRDFVTRVVHCSILLREQETQLKVQSKVWHLNTTEVSQETIEKAVTMLGFATSKAQAFDHLQEDGSEDDRDAAVNLDNSNSSSAARDSAPEDESLDDDRAESNDKDDSLTSENNSPFSHSELNLPVIRHSKYPDIQTASHQDPLDEILMPEETDEELLEEELEEEEALDKQDRVLEELHEKELWAMHKEYTAALER